MIELRLLRYFVAVAETEHVGMAARRLHVSQSPLSRQIRALEDTLGTELFVRERQRLRLSDAGRWLLKRARDVLARVEEFEREARQLAKGDVGRIAIGFVSTALWTGVLPAALRELRREHPHVQVELRLMPSQRQVAAIRAGDLDVGLVQRTGVAADLREEQVLAEPYWLALPRSSTWTRRTLRPAQLNGQAWILVTSGGVDRDRWMAAYGGAGFVPKVMVEVSDWTSALALVEAGLGMTLVPGVYRKQAPRGVVLRPVPWLRREARLAVVSRRGGTTPLVDEMVARLLAARPR
jgi:DNA-binding transcriptional LysR family regulator